MHFWESLSSIGRGKLACLVSKVDPRKTSLHRSCLYQCSVCLHVFSHKGKDRGKWCPFCRSGGRLCPRAFRGACRLCTAKTLANPKLLIAGKPAHLSIQEDALSIRQFSAQRVHILCSCGHTYTNRGKDIQDGRACPFCHSGRLCQKFIDNPQEKTCPQCFRRSFASVQICTARGTPIRELYEGDLNLDTISRFSSTKVTFRCEECQTPFTQPLRNIERGGWCTGRCEPRTKKTEHKVWLWFQHLGAQREWHPAWLSTKWISWGKRGRIVHGSYNYKFDFRLGPLILEIDGPQHYRQIARWTRPLLIQIRDEYKERQARQRGFTVLRLHQEDVLRDNIDWRNIILDAARRLGAHADEVGGNQQQGLGLAPGTGGTERLGPRVALHQVGQLGRGGSRPRVL